MSEARVASRSPVQSAVVVADGAMKKDPAAVQFMRWPWDATRKCSAVDPRAVRWLAHWLWEVRLAGPSSSQLRDWLDAEFALKNRTGVSAP